MGEPLRLEQPALPIAEKIVQILDRGGFTATYKYAVLVALMDICMERTDAKGLPPASVTTRELAQKVIELYWPHSMPYHRRDRPEHSVLLQSRAGPGKPTLIIQRIIEFRDKFDAAHAHAPSLHRAQLAAPPGAYEELLNEVEWTLIHMPLPRLQRIGRSQEDRFLYEYGFTEDTPKGQVRQYQQGQPSLFRNTLDLKPHVSTALIALNGVLRPLVYRAWASMVADMNRIELSDLEEFLVARPSRISLEPVRSDLLKLAGGRCFYCQNGIAGPCDVDHFVPWARHADNNIHNLVVTHRACNGHKSDFLASSEHVHRWAERASCQGDDLVIIAENAEWQCDRKRTFGVASAIYSALAEGSLLWVKGETFLPLNRAQVRAALEAGMSK
jgi:5-methylcytosine-specific restriction endonuclease McrA